MDRQRAMRPACPAPGNKHSAQHHPRPDAPEWKPRWYVVEYKSDVYHRSYIIFTPRCSWSASQPGIPPSPDQVFHYSWNCPQHEEPHLTPSQFLIIEERINDYGEVGSTIL